MDKIKEVFTKKGITRNIIIMAVIVAVVAVIYFGFFNKNQPKQAGGLSTVSGANIGFGAGSNQNNVSNEVAITSQQFLAQLSNINSIKIDESIVTNPALLVLKDLSKPIDPDTNPGRDNPFAPLGADSAVVSTQIITNDPTLALATSAVLNGTLSISGPNITRWFEYGPTQTLGMKTAETPQLTAGVYSENIIGLSPDTKYYVKAVASIGGQLISGNLISWQSAPIKRVGRQ
jgi:hypothetical protein